jgi:hypothetical protein
MASKKDRGAIDGGFGRGIPVTKKTANDADDEVEVIDDDVTDFFEEGDAADRRRDPLRGLLGK